MNDTPAVKTALNSPEKARWSTAINEKFESLREANTFETCNCPESGDMMFPAGIILKLKRDQHGRSARFKRRFVARGNLQPNGSRYVKLYVPVASIKLGRVLLAIAAALDWDVEQVDVKVVFIYADLPASSRIVIKMRKVVWVKAATGEYFYFLKSLYGLKQALKV